MRILGASVSRLAWIRGQHRPVLAAAVLRLLGPVPGAEILDCTLGLGGHAEGLLRHGARVVGVDRDAEARALAGERLARFGSALTIVGGTFADACETFVAEGRTFHGVLADLGASSLQFDRLDRGFSIRSEASADMRMGDGCDEDALALIDRLSVDELATVLRDFGEERRAGRVAGALKRSREAGAGTGAALAAAVARALPGRHPRHPALRSFQALRIAVNDELGQLRRLLAALPRLVAPGGRAVVISFHSLEDRLVKNSFRDQRAAGIWSDASRKVLIASDDEVRHNPRCAPAKLRWARR